MDVDATGYAHAEDLLAGPKRLGLDDDRRRDSTVPLRNPQQDVLYLVPIKETVTQRELANTAQCVLHDSHDGLVRLRRYDLQYV